jgi:hypothetical protein
VAGIPYIRYQAGLVTEGWEDNDWIELANITSEQASSFASENYWKNRRFTHEFFMACPCVGRGWETAQILVPIDHSK